MSTQTAMIEAVCAREKKRQKKLTVVSTDIRQEHGIDMYTLAGTCTARSVSPTRRAL